MAMVIGHEPNYANQRAFFDPLAFAYPVTLIGCGGIGGSIAPTLVSMGIDRLTLVDPDTVEPSNEAMTVIYGHEDVGKPKVDALAAQLRRLSARTVDTVESVFDPDHAFSLDGIVISGVDSMAARKAIWTVVKESPLVTLYLDGRVGGHGYTLCTVDPMEPDDIDWYERSMLFDDDHAAELPCTGDRGWVGPAVALGPIMGAQLIRLLNGKPYANYYSHNLLDGLDPIQYSVRKSSNN